MVAASYTESKYTHIQPGRDCGSDDYWLNYSSITLNLIPVIYLDNYGEWTWPRNCVITFEWSTDILHHFIHEQVEDRTYEIIHCATHLILANKTSSLLGVHLLLWWTWPCAILNYILDSNTHDISPFHPLHNRTILDPFHTQCSHMLLSSQSSWHQTEGKVNLSHTYAYTHLIIRIVLFIFPLVVLGSTVDLNIFFI